MTTELEKQFFEVFEIPKIFKTTINTGDLDLNYVEIQAPTLKELYEEALFDFETPIYFSWFKRSKRWSEEYPQITDRHYLELIVLLSGVCCMNFAFERSLDEMKYKILKITMEYKKILKHQVQEIFKG
jgi:hypothetical protein